MIQNQLCKVTKYLTESAKSSCRSAAKKFGLSKSSVNRHQQKVEARSEIRGASYFETEDGQTWILEFVVASIMIFGILCGIGSDRIALFISLLKLNHFAGLSASSLREIESQIDKIIIQYKNTYDAEVKENCKDVEVVIGADETFLAKIMCLVLMDLKSGFVFTEEIKERRDHATWSEVSRPWTDGFNNIKSFLSDRAKALLKLSKDTLLKNRVADLFHIMNRISSVMKFSFDRRYKSLQSELKGLEAKARKGCRIRARIIDLKRLIPQVLRDKKRYQKHLRRLSISLHPFKVLSNIRQTSDAVNTRMQSSLSEIKQIKEEHNVSDKSKKMNGLEKEIESASSNVNEWWSWVDNSLNNAEILPELRQWLSSDLLPYYYWKNAIGKSSSKLINRFYEISFKNCAAKIKIHPDYSLESIDQKWIDWAETFSTLFVRTTSALEGRNQWITQTHYNGRGLTSERLKSQTAMRNYFLEDQSGRTPCEKLTKIKPECLFQYILKNIGPLKQPRIGKNMKLPQALIHQGVPA
jgi:hypothetical protein